MMEGPELFQCFGRVRGLASRSCRFVMTALYLKSGLAKKQTCPKLANRRTAGRVRYRSPGRRCLDRPVETGMADRGQVQGASRFLRTRCGRCCSYLLLLLPDLRCVPS